MHYFVTREFILIDDCSKPLSVPCVSLTEWFKNALPLLQTGILRILWPKWNPWHESISHENRYLLGNWGPPSVCFFFFFSFFPSSSLPARLPPFLFSFFLPSSSFTFFLFFLLLPFLLFLLPLPPPPTPPNPPPFSFNWIHSYELHYAFPVGAILNQGDKDWFLRGVDIIQST